MFMSEETEQQKPTTGQGGKIYPREAIGKRVQIVRESLGMSCSKFAQALGVSRQRVNGWENEGKRPDDESLGKIKRLGSVTLDWLMEGDTGGMPYPVMLRLIASRDRLALTEPLIALTNIE